MGLPPLLPDFQFTCILDAVVTATERIGALGGAAKQRPPYVFTHYKNHKFILCSLINHV